MGKHLRYTGWLERDTLPETDEELLAYKIYEALQTTLSEPQARAYMRKVHQLELLPSGATTLISTWCTGVDSSGQHWRHLSTVGFAACGALKICEFNPDKPYAYERVIVQYGVGRIAIGGAAQATQSGCLVETLSPTPSPNESRIKAVHTLGIGLDDINAYLAPDDNIGHAAICALKQQVDTACELASGQQRALHGFQG